MIFHKIISSNLFEIFLNLQELMYLSNLTNQKCSIILNSYAKKYFDLDNVRDWKNKLEEVKLFIDTNNVRPTLKTNKELHNWLSNQLNKSKERKEIKK